jgi:hypothetical protein
MKPVPPAINKFCPERAKKLFPTLLIIDEISSGMII